jgi:hypothetical protein
LLHRVGGLIERVCAVDDRRDGTGLDVLKHGPIDERRRGRRGFGVPTARGR